MVWGFFTERETVRVGDFWGEACNVRDGNSGGVGIAVWLKGAGSVGHLRGGLGRLLKGLLFVPSGLDGYGDRPEGIVERVQLELG